MYKHVLVSLFFMTGCSTVSATKTEANNPCQQSCNIPDHKVTTTNQVNQETDSNQQNVDTDKSVATLSGEMIGYTTKMVWDNAQKAYVYVSNVEVKDKAGRAWQNVKKAAVDVKDGVVKGYNK